MFDIGRDFKRGCTYIVIGSKIEGVGNVSVVCSFSFSLSTAESDENSEATDKKKDEKKTDETSKETDQKEEKEADDPNKNEEEETDDPNIKSFSISVRGYLRIAAFGWEPGELVFDFSKLPKSHQSMRSIYIISNVYYTPAMKITVMIGKDRNFTQVTSFAIAFCMSKYEVDPETGAIGKFVKDIFNRVGKKGYRWDFMSEFLPPEKVQEVITAAHSPSPDDLDGFFPNAVAESVWLRRAGLTPKSPLSIEITRLLEESGYFDDELLMMEDDDPAKEQKCCEYAQHMFDDIEHLSGKREHLTLPTITSANREHLALPTITVTPAISQGQASTPQDASFLRVPKPFPSRKRKQLRKQRYPGEKEGIGEQNSQQTTSSGEDVEEARNFWIPSPIPNPKRELKFDSPQFLSPTRPN